MCNTLYCSCCVVPAQHTEGGSELSGDLMLLLEQNSVLINQKWHEERKNTAKKLQIWNAETSIWSIMLNQSRPRYLVQIFKSRDY